MSHCLRAIGVVLPMIALSSCAGSAPPVMPVNNAVPLADRNQLMQGVGQEGLLPALPTPIKHVVIIIQENRTPDYLFQGVPGADISKYAIDSQGERVELRPISLSAGYDLKHGHKDFVTDYDNGKLDGFDAGMPQREHLRPFGYAPDSEVRPYHDMAREYSFGDHMFQSNQGPSFPAHLYLVSGTATERSIAQDRVSDNPLNRRNGHGGAGGCDAKPSVVVATIMIKTGMRGPTIFPCLNPPVLSDFLDAKQVSWRYYQTGSGAGLWHPFDAIRHVRYGADYQNVITRSQQVLTDIRRGRLAGVTWISPAHEWSDHAGKDSTTEGPSWVSAIVNAIGTSQYWKTTAIFVVWDDWGGWYDHVPPPIYNAYELGFRVPLLVISPYAKRGYVSKVPHEFGSILAFTEEAFGIPKGALHATDVRADDLRDSFDFSQRPRDFVRIKAPPFRPSASEGSTEEDP